MFLAFTSRTAGNLAKRGEILGIVAGSDNAEDEGTDFDFYLQNPASDGASPSGSTSPMRNSAGFKAHLPNI